MSPPFWATSDLEGPYTRQTRADTGSVTTVLGYFRPHRPLPASNKGEHRQCHPRSGLLQASPAPPGVKQGGTQAVSPPFWATSDLEGPYTRQTRADTVSVRPVLGYFRPLGRLPASNKGRHRQCHPRSGPLPTSEPPPHLKQGPTPSVSPPFWATSDLEDPSAPQTRPNTVSVTPVLGHFRPRRPSQRQTRPNTVSVTPVLGHFGPRRPSQRQTRGAPPHPRTGPHMTPPSPTTPSCIVPHG